jgi:hypothetical protein
MTIERRLADVERRLDQGASERAGVVVVYDPAACPAGLAEREAFFQALTPPRGTAVCFIPDNGRG